MRPLALALAVVLPAALLSGCKRPAPPESPPPAPALPTASPEDIARLRDPDVQARGDAVRALNEPLVLPPEAVEPLVALLGDTALVGELRAGPDASPVVRALSKCGKAAVGPLCRALDSDDVPTRVLAACALGHIGPLAVDALPALEAPRREPFLMPVVENAIAHFRISRKVDAIRRLVELVRGAGADQLGELARGLSRCGPAVAEFDDVFVPLLETQERFGWQPWARLASELGPGAKRAAAVVVRRIVEEQGVVLISADVLIRFGPALAPGLPEFRKIIAKKGDYSLQTALPHIGPGTDSVPELLERCRKDRDGSESALAAIAALGPTPEAIAFARVALREPGPPWVHRASARLLGAAGPAARDAMPEVRAALEHKEFPVRAWALYAAFRIEGATEPHLDRLRHELTNPDRLSAGGVFVSDVAPVLAPDAPEVVPLVLEWAKGFPEDRTSLDSGPTRAELLTGLAGYGPAAEGLVPLLAGGLGRPQRWHWESTQVQLCEALGRMGPAAEGALPALRATASSPGWKPAHAALKAIAAIEKPQ